MVLIGAAIPVLAFVAYDFAARPVPVQAPTEVSLGKLTYVGSPVRLVPIRNAHWWRSIDVLRFQSSCSCSLVTPSSDHLGPRETLHLAITPRVRPWDTSFLADIYTTAGGVMLGRTRLTAELVAPFEGWPEQCVVRRAADGRLVAPVSPAYSGQIRRVVVHAPGGGGFTVPPPAAEMVLDFSPVEHRVPLDGTAEMEVLFGEAPSTRWSCWLVSGDAGRDAAQAARRNEQGE